MRNKNIILLAIFILSIFSLPVIAQETPTAEPTEEVTEAPQQKVSPTGSLDAEVDKLKEKVEEKVLGLKKENDKATSGIIKSIGDSLVVTDDSGKDIKVKLDNTLTTYNEVKGTSIAEIKKENFKKGDYVFIQGPDINGTVTANAVYKDQKYLIFSGKITEVDSTNFTITVITLDKTTYTFDIQNSTSQQMLDIKTFVPEKVGFSKLKEGDSIHIVVEANLVNPNATRFDAEKVLIIPNEYFIQ